MIYDAQISAGFLESINGASLWHVCIDVGLADIVDCFAVLNTDAGVDDHCLVIVIITIIAILTLAWSVAAFLEDNTQSGSYFLKCKVLYVAFADMET